MPTIRTFINYILVFVLSFTFIGCGILRPKNVELFQDKVKAVPEKSDKLREAEKQAAVFVKDQVNLARDAAIKENSSTNIVNPLNEAKLVVEPLSLSLGAPAVHWNDDGLLLAKQLEKENSKLDKKVEDYRKDTQENVGKKIEGTGWINTSYFSMIGIILVIGFILYIVIKILGIIYPVVGVGTSLARIPASVVSTAFSQVLKGGEKFKEKLDATFDDETVKNKILEIFSDSQQIAQSPEVQEIIKKLTLSSKK